MHKRSIKHNAKCMESNFTDLKRKEMIKEIEGLKKYTDCSMPNNEKQRIEKAECAAYNQAIEDVVKLFSIHNVVDTERELLSFSKFLLNRSYVRGKYYPETLVKLFKGK